MGVPCPKPEPLKRINARKKRTEDKVQAQVRREVFARDEGCRVWSPRDLSVLSDPVMVCNGRLTLAHLERRSKNMRAAPEKKHRVDRCVVLCLRHHQMEEGKLRPRILWEFLTEDGANGSMVWRFVA